MLDDVVFNARSPLITYTSRVWRIVEAQEHAATLNLVDTMEDQELLESLLDDVKPPYRKGTEGMHYLLKTPFRYPPLRHGSRFGTKLMPSFFYASEKPSTALAETAYYRFVFLSDITDPYEKEIDSFHTMFSATVSAKDCLDLSLEPYGRFRDRLIDPTDYRFCQRVGDWAVNQRCVQLIRAESARLTSTFNVAIAEPSVIRSRIPSKLQSWLCRTTPTNIGFSSRGVKGVTAFHIEDFYVGGVLPRPA